MLFAYSKIGRNIHFNYISVCSSESVAATSDLTWIGCSSVVKIIRDVSNTNTFFMGTKHIRPAEWWTKQTTPTRLIIALEALTHEKHSGLFSQCGRPIKIREIIMCLIYIGHNVREWWSYCYVKSAYRTNIGFGWILFVLLWLVVFVSCTRRLFFLTLLNLINGGHWSIRVGYIYFFRSPLERLSSILFSNEYSHFMEINK